METIQQQKKQFYIQVYPSQPNEWEVDDVFEKLAELPDHKRELLLSFVEAIWPVSHSLCFSYLTDGMQAVKVLPQRLLADWVREILSLYESHGLVGARAFMQDFELFVLHQKEEAASVAFQQVAPLLVHYLRGISGRGFELRTASIPLTDFNSVYLPEQLEILATDTDNRLLYRLLATLMSFQVKMGLFSLAAKHFELTCSSEITHVGGSSTAMENKLFSPYKDKDLARDILAVLQFVYSFRYMQKQLPGLAIQGEGLCRFLLDEVEFKGGDSLRSKLFVSLLRQAFSDSKTWQPEELNSQDTNKLPDISFDYHKIFFQLESLYGLFYKIKDPYGFGEFQLLLGKFSFDRSVENLLKKRESDKARFAELLGQLIRAVNALKQNQSTELNVENEESFPAEVEEIVDALVFAIKTDKERTERHSTSFRIENSNVEFAPELLDLAKEIYDDFGMIPEAYVQAAAGIGGSGVQKKEDEEGENTSSGIRSSIAVGQKYDEWDYRRNGYRKRWCTLYEKTLGGVKSSFRSDTLVKYKYQLQRLKHQFEMLRIQHRHITKQRFGDEIDLDALIDALGDQRAGRSPSERLFIRLQRNQRDISTIFLVDMSNSTEGWVGVAIKEALILLSEALEVVGDSYGIYGFSGMRRSKCEVYQIKGLDELANETVYQRISAITPMEYTRMGPAIRHVSSKLQEAPGKIRLLIILSDGKPEDYDDYKSDYAIEDTKKALLEARGASVVPFCITIDKISQDYHAHMYGRGNYIFVNNVNILPQKMSEMYRLLTS